VPDDKRIDSDWKRRAAEEKEKIAQMLGGGAPAGGAAKGAARATPGAASAVDAAGPAPAGANSSDARTDPVFVRLISTLGGQAMMALGLAEDPHTGERFLDLDLARQSIDMLGAIEAKSRGNLSAEEEGLLVDVLHQLRITYAQRVQQAQAAATREAPPGRPGGPGR
jgi:hypothetical protein